MSKVKKAFFCQNCGYESVKWNCQCTWCGQGNVFVEELIQKETTNNNNKVAIREVFIINQGWYDMQKSKLI